MKYRKCSWRRDQLTIHTRLNLPVYRKNGLLPCMQQTSVQALWYSERAVLLSHRKNSALHQHWWLKRILQSFEKAHYPSYQIQSLLQSVDEKELLTDKDSILNHLSEHFHTLFSASYMVQEQRLKISQQPMKIEMDVLLTLEGTIKTIVQLKNRKATGTDGIQPEIWLTGGLMLLGARKYPSRPLWYSHHHPIQKERRRVWLFKLSWHKSALHMCQIIAKVLLNSLVPTIAEEYLP